MPKFHVVSIVALGCMLAITMTSCSLAPSMPAQAATLRALTPQELQQLVAKYPWDVLATQQTDVATIILYRSGSTTGYYVAQMRGDGVLTSHEAQGSSAVAQPITVVGMSTSTVPFLAIALSDDIMAQGAATVTVTFTDATSATTHVQEQRGVILRPAPGTRWQQIQVHDRTGKDLGQVTR